MTRRNIPALLWPAVAGYMCVLAGCTGRLSGNAPAALDAAGVDLSLGGDASRADFGAHDASSVDAASADLGAFDAGGIAVDAGLDAFIATMDAGADAASGSMDAGADAASGSMDAGPMTDAGATVDAGDDASWPVIDGGPSSTRHVKRPLGSTAATAGYWEYLPPAYGEVDGVRFPLMVFYHGVGENGDGSSAALDLVLANGPPMIIADDDWPLARPFVVLSPQHPGWDCPSATEIHDFITYAASHYDVDPRRIYLTGLSCGAIGSWSYYGAYADEKQIAAIVPIAGNGEPAWAAQGCDLGKIAVWAFHGDADTTVWPGGTTGPMTHLINECPSPPRREALMTIYPGVGHSSWWQTYNLTAGHDIYAWMLTQTND
ncbi:MAG: hypothetical protein IPK60_00900 [Sandaracinaceae bacterium]|nr:hypothetical protein [Sandaracinaceae bacterium]